MKWKFINVPLGVSETPIGTSRKNVAAAAAIGGSSSIFGSLIDYYAALDTAKENRWSQREVNESNERINQEQLAWARENYEMEKEENRYLVDLAYQRELENREYNAAKNEMKRLREAGLNPYLAKYGVGSSGGVGSIGTTVGSPPRHNQPNMIPMQASHEQPFEGFGRGVSNAVAAYYQGKDSERADYALASDITFRDQENRRKTRELLLEERKQLFEESKWNENGRDRVNKDIEKIDSDIEHLRKSDELERDKFEHQKTYDDVQQRIDDYRAKTERYRANTERTLADSQISVNDETKRQINSNIARSEEEVKQMVANGASKRKIEEYIAQQEEVILNQLKDEYIRTHNQFEYEQNAPVLMKKYRQVANYMLEPLRGVISAGVNAGVSAAKKVP